MRVGTALEGPTASLTAGTDDTASRCHPTIAGLRTSMLLLKLNESGHHAPILPDPYRRNTQFPTFSCQPHRATISSHDKTTKQSAGVFPGKVSCMGFPKRVEPKTPDGCLIGRAGLTAHISGGTWLPCSTPCLLCANSHWSPDSSSHGIRVLLARPTKSLSRPDLASEFRIEVPVASSTARAW